MNSSDLEQAGFEVDVQNHAWAVITQDFPELWSELCAALLKIEIEDTELVKGGGGQAQSTQRLAQSLTDKGWIKHKFEIQKLVDGEKGAEFISHEIDHVRRTENGRVALEIEWNNKDPFFDRDLANFQRLHAEGAISLGVIVTRGQLLQRELRMIVHQWALDRDIGGYEDLEKFGVDPTARQRKGVATAMKSGQAFIDAWPHKFVQDKFGAATTHWDKLQDRIRRGVGHLCPLLLIGIPPDVIKRTGA